MVGMSGAVSTFSASSGGDASGSPVFNWRYYAYGSSMGLHMFSGVKLTVLTIH